MQQTVTGKQYAVDCKTMYIDSKQDVLESKQYTVYNVQGTAEGIVSIYTYKYSGMLRLFNSKQYTVEVTPGNLCIEILFAKVQFTSCNFVT